MKKKIPSHLMTLLNKYDIASPEESKEYSKEELDQFIDRVERLIQQKKKGHLEIPNQGNKLFLANIMQVVMLGITGAATFLGEQGLGPLPIKDENDKKIAKQFTFDVMMHMVIGTSLPTLLFQVIARTTGTNEKKQKIIAEALELTTLLIVIHAATKGNEDRMASLFDSFSEKIEKRIDMLGTYLNEEINAENISKVTSEQLSLKLQQSKLALQKGEVNKFINVCKETLGLLDISPDLLEKNLKEIDSFVNTLSEAMSTKEESTTSLAQAM